MQIHICATGANSVEKKYWINYQPKNAGVGIQKYTGAILNVIKAFTMSISAENSQTMHSHSFTLKMTSFIGTGWTGKYDGYFERWFDF